MSERAPYVVLPAALLLLAVCALWYSYEVDSYPETQVLSGGKMARLTPEQYLATLEKLGTRGSDGRFYKGVNQVYERTRETFARRKQSSRLLFAGGIACLLASVALFWRSTAASRSPRSDGAAGV